MATVLDRLLDGVHARPPIRAGSLIVSVFGDAVAPRGGRLALSSLLEIMRAFRISDGLVRTALSRLVAEGWFERWKVGRNSYYRLSARGRRTFAEATDKIYGTPERRWTGTFDLVLLDAGAEKAELRSALEARGYGVLTPDLMVAPGSAAPDEGGFLRFSASPAGGVQASQVAARAWPLVELERGYEAFIERFTPAQQHLTTAESLGDLEALLLRILLIHDYRRIILRDPLLPAELLPPDWAGRAARHLCGGIYRAVAPAAERWLDENAADDRGPLPHPGQHVSERFRDLG